MQGLTRLTLAGEEEEEEEEEKEGKTIRFLGYGDGCMLPPCWAIEDGSGNAVSYSNGCMETTDWSGSVCQVGWSQHGRSRLDCESHYSQRISLKATPRQVNNPSGASKRIFKIPIPQHYESLVSFQAVRGSKRESL
jgi:hypothetical protein